MRNVMAAVIVGMALSGGCAGDEVPASGADMPGAVTPTPSASCLQARELYCYRSEECRGSFTESELTTCRQTFEAAFNCAAAVEPTVIEQRGTALAPEASTGALLTVAPTTFGACMSALETAICPRILGGAAAFPEPCLRVLPR